MRINVKQTILAAGTLVAILIVALSCRSGSDPIIGLAGGSMVRRLTLTVSSPTGGANVSIGATTSNGVIGGIIRGIHLGYQTTAVTTTDIEIASPNPDTDVDQPILPILTVTDVGTDTWKYPLALPVNITNTTLGLVNVGHPIYVDGRVVMTVTGANVTDIFTATIIYEQLR